MSGSIDSYDWLSDDDDLGGDVIFRGKRFSLRDFCSQDMTEMQKMRKETVETILLSLNHYHTLGISLKERNNDDIEETVREAYLEKSLIVHPMAW